MANFMEDRFRALKFVGMMASHGGLRCGAFIPSRMTGNLAFLEKRDARRSTNGRGLLALRFTRGSYLRGWGIVRVRVSIPSLIQVMCWEKCSRWRQANVFR